MKLRPVLTAVAAVAALALLLTGCQSKVGLAATVGDDTISVSDVNDNVYPLSLAAAQAAGHSTVESQVYTSRATVLFYLIRESLFEQTLAKLGKTPTQAELDAKHDIALQQIFQSSSANTGAQGDQALADALDRIGIERSFATHLLRAWELELILADVTGAQSDSDIAALIKDKGLAVTVSERYGSWDAQTMNLNQRTDPDFLTVVGSSSPTG